MNYICRKYPLLYPPFIQRLPILFCILQMLRIRLCETVFAAEIGLGAHIDVVVVVVVEHSVDGGLFGKGNRRRRKSSVFVSVVRRIHLQHRARNAPDAKIPYRKDHRRVALQRHPNPQPVEIKPRNRGLFLAMHRLFALNDGCQRRNLYPREIQSLGFFLTLLIPKIIVIKPRHAT